MFHTNLIVFFLLASTIGLSMASVFDHPTCEFTIKKPFDGSQSIGVSILVQPVGGGGAGVSFTVEVTDVALIGDIRGVFFHVNPDVDLTTVSIAGATSSQVGPANEVIKIPGARDVTMDGDGGIHTYDIGVEIGSQGIGNDDIQKTIFNVFGITFADVDFSQEFGVRLTSVGKGDDRELSSKIFGRTDCSKAPSAMPSGSVLPSLSPSTSVGPSAMPSSKPSASPSAMPSAKPSASPSSMPSTSIGPSAMPSAKPSAGPSAMPSAKPSARPSAMPSTSVGPSAMPSAKPSASPSAMPSTSVGPSAMPSAMPSASPSAMPSAKPSARPSAAPSNRPSAKPTNFQDPPRPSCIFLISKSFSGPNILVQITVKPAVGEEGVMINVKVTDTKLIGDIRGVFFHLGPGVDLDATPEKVTIVGKNVTSSQVGPADSVVDLGNGATMSGDGGKHKYDVGVAIGTQGIGKGDDYRETTFIVKGITFANIDFSQEFGVRLTSVGTSSSRNLSSKVFGLSGCVAVGSDIFNRYPKSLRG